jgi:hypothetical protein
MSIICPKCGSTKSQIRSALFSSSQVCLTCLTRYTKPKPLWERLLFASVFVFLGLFLGIVALFILLITNGDKPPHPDSSEAGMVCGGFVSVLALLCVVQAFRELEGRDKSSGERSKVGTPDEIVEHSNREFHSSAPPLVPEEQAERLVREIAEKHKAKGILRKLGAFRSDHIENAVRHFADQMDEEETPLAFIDTSFLGNGKRGLLVTNRAVYSSNFSRPLWLVDIDEVTYEKPDPSDIALINVFAVLLVAVHFLSPNPMRYLAHAVLFALIVFALPIMRFKHRLLINSKIVCKRRLRGAFWIELLTALASAAREVPPSPLSDATVNAPSFVVLETTHSHGDGASCDTRQFRDPPWQQIEQSIRALDADGHPSLRIWAGEVEQAPALDIFGGNGKYALRELGDGWIYYDPHGGEDEVEVCICGAGHRCPAFYVCTDLDRVLGIARHFVETGTPE